MKNSPPRLFGIIVAVFFLCSLALPPSAYGQSSATVSEQKQLASVLSALQEVLLRLDGVFSALMPSRSQGLAAISASVSQGLVGYWNFDEGAGTTAADSSGNGNTGTIQGATPAAGKIGQALNFDGVDDVVNAGSAASLDNLSPLTAAAWVYPRNVDEDSSVVEKRNTGTFDSGWNFQITGNFANIGSIQFIKDGSTDLSRRSSNNVLQNNRWYHIAATWDGTTNASGVTLYANGVETSYASSANGVSLVSDAAQSLGMGASVAGLTRPLDGLIDEVRIYNRALSAAEITTLYQEGSGSSPPPPPVPPPTPPPADTTPPVLSSGVPTGTLAAGTTQTTLSLTTTNENATCKYDTTAHTPHSNMAHTFSTTGSTGHATAVTGLTDGSAYTYYVRCKDTAGNVNTADYAISFSVAAPVIVPSGPHCSDNIDNDVDGKKDYPEDPGCSSTADADEYNVSPLPSPVHELIAGGLMWYPATSLGPNLLVNPGLEQVDPDGKPTGWKGSVAFSLDTTIGHAGSNSFRLKDAPNFPYAESGRQPLFLRKGSYRVSGWVKTDLQDPNTADTIDPCVRLGLSDSGTTHCIGLINNWTYLEKKNLVITQDGNHDFQLGVWNEPAGSAWFDDLELHEELQFPIDVFMLYPNYRGYLFDDQSQTLKFDVSVNPPANSQLSDWNVEISITDEAGSAVVISQSYPATSNFQASFNSSSLLNGKTYLARFKLLSRSSGKPVYEYPSYRISKVSGSSRASMAMSFDENNRILFNGKPKFLLGTYDSGGGYTASEASWEATLFSPTGSRRMGDLPVNFWFNYWLGNMPNSSAFPLLNVLQKHGIQYLTNANCFGGKSYEQMGGGWFFNADDSDAMSRGQYPGFSGYYSMDECNPEIASDNFGHYEKMRRTDPDGIVFGASNKADSLSYWRDTVDLLSMDPYPLYGAEPAGGYNLSSGTLGVADWTRATRLALKNSRPVATVIQFFKFTASGRWPTKDELRNMSYMSIAEGANGLWYWSLGVNALAYICNGSSPYYSPAGSGSWCQARVDNFNNLKEVITELASLQPALSSIDRNDLLSLNSNAAIHTRVQYADDKGYLIASNYTNSTTTATFTWGQAPSAVGAYNENRSLNLAANSFSDTFGPYQAHVYEILAGAVPVPPPTPTPIPMPPPTPTPTPTPLPKVEFHRGIYALFANNDEVGNKEIEAVHKNPDVAGVVIRTTWKTLEPQEGQYDWSYLDRQIDLAAQHGKKASVHIRTARDADIQDWLLAKGPLLFKHSDGTIIVPWDPVFLTHWTRFLRAFGERYKDNPNIAYVNALTGSVTNGWGMPDVDIEGKTWFDPKYSYTHEKLMGAMKQVVDTIMRPFPYKKVLVAVGKIGFETTPEKRFLAGNEIAQYVSRTYPNQYAVFREDIYACTPNPPVDGYWLTLWNHKGKATAQLLRAASGNQEAGPLKCLSEAQKTPAGIITATANNAFAYGMPYLEVYKTDLLAAKADTKLAEALHYMKTKLVVVESSPPTPTPTPLPQVPPAPPTPPPSGDEGEDGGGRGLSFPPTPTPSPVPTPMPLPTPGTKLFFTKSLYFGIKDPEVTNLQRFLIQKGHLPPGNDTGFFGPLTESAVKKFQCDKGIVCGGSAEETGYGLVGKLTRQKLNEVSSIGSPHASPEQAQRQTLIGTRGGDQVRLLQTFLSQDPTVYPEGLVTGYYGPLTVAAVKRFQAKHGLVTSGTPETTGFGHAGPKTRAKLNELYGGTSVAP